MRDQEPTTLEVCVDCLMLLANGEVSDGEGNDITDAHAAKIEAVWGDTEITLGRITPQQFVVIENTPGYLPEDDDPFVTDDYSAAVEYLNERAAEYADDPDGNYRVEYGLASSGNYAAVLVHDDGKSHDLGRWIAVENYDDDDESEPWFSWSQCDGCHSNLGGDREYATAWIAPLTDKEN